MPELRPPERYAGWLRGNRTPSVVYDTHRTDTLVEFSCGWVDLRYFKWSRTLESTFRTGERCYFLVLMLDGPVEPERRNPALAQVAHYGGRRVRLVPPGQTICSVSTADGELRAMRCFIDAAFVEAICSSKPSFEERAQLGAVDFSGGAIEWLLYRMYREIRNADIGMAIGVESIAQEIAVEIARTIERRRGDAHRLAGGLPSWRMRLMLERIYADGPLPSRSELAEICGMTVRHLGRAFRAETGKSLGKFVASAMAERASEMLEAGSRVGAVAAKLGYTSSSSFAHAFRRETGILPSSVRQERRRSP